MDVEKSLGLHLSSPQPRPSSHTLVFPCGGPGTGLKGPAARRLGPGPGLPPLAVFISSSLFFVPTLSPKNLGIPSSSGMGKTKSCLLVIMRSWEEEGLQRPWGPHRQRSSQAWALG